MPGRSPITARSLHRAEEADASSGLQLHLDLLRGLWKQSVGSSLTLALSAVRMATLADLPSCQQQHHGQGRRGRLTGGGGLPSQVLRARH